MGSTAFKIIQAYYENYVEPLNRSMYPDRQRQFYPDQEQTYTDLSQLDSQHGGLTFKERYPLNYPETHWNNPWWADGDFQNAYKSDFFQHEKYTPNENISLYDPLKGASLKTVNNIPKGSYKLACIDLNDFFKMSGDTLIHKSKEDLWKMFKDEDGNVYIKRLFEDETLLKD